MMINQITLIVAALILLRTAADLWLDALNRRAVERAADAVPEPFRGFIDAATYRKSVEYTLTKNRFGMWESLFNTAVLFAVVFTGFLAWVWGALQGVLGTSPWGQALIIFVVAALLALPGLPWDWHSTFRIEERFGFNKETPRLWISDKLKGALVGFVIGYPLLVVILWLVGLSALWWLWAFAVFFAFQLVMLVVYPMFIMPLFNKFEELPQGELRERLMALSDRTGFRAKTILVMDGSRRSGHSNAFFTGFGRFRRIVLYDTLIAQLSVEQLEAVLAHEIGHYKLGHIPRMIAWAALSLLAGFAAIGWLAASPWFVEAFGFAYAPGLLAPTLMLFALLSGSVTFWITPLGNWVSRMHEYQADRFAREALGGNPAPLVESLRILSEKNLSNLTPHPLFSAFHYSHPTLLERERALAAR